MSVAIEIAILRDHPSVANGGVNLILVLFSLCARISGTMTPFADAGDSADGGVN